MAEGDGPGFSTMLATNPKFDVRAHSTSVFDGDADQSAYPSRVEHLKRIVRKDTMFDIGRKKTPGVVPAQPICSLSQVICSKREEFSAPGDLPCGKGRPRQLDHRSDCVADALAHDSENLICRVFEDRPLIVELGDSRYEWNHDLRMDVDSATRCADCSLEDRSALHFGDFRKRDSKTASAVSEHRIVLAEAFDDSPELVAREAQ